MDLEEYIKAILSIMNEKNKTEVSIYELAVKVNKSPVYLTHICKSIVAKHPDKFVYSKGVIRLKE